VKFLKRTRDEKIISRERRVEEIDLVEDYLNAKYTPGPDREETFSTEELVILDRWKNIIKVLKPRRGEWLTV